MFGTLSACTDGGQHQRGTTGEWLVRCVKCGVPC